MRLVRRFGLAAATLVAALSVTACGCDPCSLACLACASAASGPPPTQAVVQPQGELVRAEARMVREHTVENAAQRY